MAITTQITARSVFGSNPSGFTPLVPANSGYEEFVQSGQYTHEFLVSGVTYVSGDIPATKDAFLDMVQTELETNYFPTIFSDGTKDYDVVIYIQSIKLDFSPAVGTDRSIWTERIYSYRVGYTYQANVS